MSDRHEKWTPVEPGHVIPAGQPYMVEYENAADGRTRCEFTRPHEVRAGFESQLGWVNADRQTGWFVDSSWRPKLDLPTEPTWGIAVYEGRKSVGIWCANENGMHFDQVGEVTGARTAYAKPLAFIPLTDEQVARIEATR